MHAETRGERFSLGISFFSFNLSLLIPLLEERLDVSVGKLEEENIEEEALWDGR